jgi:alpha-N-arabinofuranosidase
MIGMRFAGYAMTTMAALALAPHSAAAQTGDPVRVSIDAKAKGPKISRNIYGQFSEHLGKGIYEGIWVGPDSPIPNTQGYRTDVLNALKKLRIPVIRWPGGCFADYYNWRDGIGPRSKRPVRVNTNWGNVLESNAFGTHEFMNLTELLGADAYIAGNMGSAPPRDMADWYEYLTSDSQSTLANERRKNGRDKPWKVSFWGIGNESWGCGGRMRPEYTADLTRRYTTFIRNAQDKPLYRVASGPNDDEYGGLPYRFSDLALNYTEVMMKQGSPGDAFNGLSIHHYAFPGDWVRHGQALGFNEDDWARTLAAAAYVEKLIDRHGAIMDKYDPDKKVGMIIDEWGTWYDAAPGADPNLYFQQSSVRDAIVAGFSLNIFHRNADRVHMANIAQMVNVDQAMVLTDGPRMVVTPTYHVFDMYQPFKDATLLPLKVNGPRYRRGSIDLPAVDASAARALDGKIYLALVNLDPNRAAEVAATIDGVTARRAAGQILTGAAMDSHNSFDQPNRIRPAPFAGKVEKGRLVFRLPAKSVVVVGIEE